MVNLKKNYTFSGTFSDFLIRPVSSPWLLTKRSDSNLAFNIFQIEEDACIENTRLTQ